MGMHSRVVYFGIVDSLIVFFSVYVSTVVMFPSSDVFSLQLLILSSTLIVCHHVFASYNKLYKRAWEYAGVEEMVVIFKSITLSVVLATAVQFFISADVYLRVLASAWMIQLLFISASRFSWRWYRDKKVAGRSVKEGKRTLIIGAGSAGTMVARQMKNKSNCDLLPVAFIDDDPRKHQLHILSLPVVGGMDLLADTIEDMQIEKLIIAIPSLSKKELSMIKEKCLQTGVETQSVPMYEDLVMGKLTVTDMKEVKIDDLLGRHPVDLETAAMEGFISGRTVLVTGAGGSIGSEICRQLSQFSPSRVVLLGHGENSIYAIEMELKESFGDHVEYVTEIADIKDRERMFDIMHKYEPEVVIHAAAHKHVPLMEKNPDEAIRNNVWGTKNVAEAADAWGVATFVMISSDKAVNPTSVMGSTKRVAEMIVKDLDKQSATRFVAVRFGNVLGSRGSVIPRFVDQIKRGGPVTVTDPEMTRYFMTIPEASKLVLQAASLAQGGEIFVLDMGEPVKIVDLARNLIELSGFREDEIGITFTGVRPGEKLYEELLNVDEIQEEQVHPRIHVGVSPEVDVAEVMDRVEAALLQDAATIRTTLLEIANRGQTLTPAAL
ncbi:polysaccharide biosynthesis protein [Thalassobacillus hwangdonensis]|uniref:Polysaccharide biosynthesis protein n=1 Tax=Thalassobacillus hwangdonensis TaxID=546108 RepID=A0ABW3L4Y3_9BACI